MHSQQGSDHPPMEGTQLIMGSSPPPPPPSPSLQKLRMPDLLLHPCKSSFPPSDQDQELGELIKKVEDPTTYTSSWCCSSSGTITDHDRDRNDNNNIIIRDDVPVYSLPPDQLILLYGGGGGGGGHQEESAWYFFTTTKPVTSAKATGTKQKRCAGNGWWKATGRTKDIWVPIKRSANMEGGTNIINYVENKKVRKTSLAYYMKINAVDVNNNINININVKRKKDEKTEWLMKEFRVPIIDANGAETLSNEALCKLYRTPRRRSTSTNINHHNIGEALMTPPGSSSSGIVSASTCSGYDLIALDHIPSSLSSADNTAEFDYGGSTAVRDQLLFGGNYRDIGVAPPEHGVEWTSAPALAAADGWDANHIKKNADNNNVGGVLITEVAAASSSGLASSSSGCHERGQQVMICEDDHIWLADLLSTVDNNAEVDHDGRSASSWDQLELGSWSSVSNLFPDEQLGIRNYSMDMQDFEAPPPPDEYWRPYYCSSSSSDLPYLDDFQYYSSCVDPTSTTLIPTGHVATVATETWPAGGNYSLGSSTSTPCSSNNRYLMEEDMIFPLWNNITDSSTIQKNGATSSSAEMQEQVIQEEVGNFIDSDLVDLGPAQTEARNS